MVGTIIEKEDIINHKIIASKIDKSDELRSKLADAQRLGNEFKSKTSIVFNTIDGPLRVETTVWSLTDKYIQLKNGILIPLNSIIEVDL